MLVDNLADNLPWIICIALLLAAICVLGGLLGCLLQKRRLEAAASKGPAGLGEGRAEHQGAPAGAAKLAERLESGAQARLGEPLGSQARIVFEAAPDEWQAAGAGDERPPEEDNRIQIRQPLRVAILGARILDGALAGLSDWGKPEPFCTCEVVGRPGSRFETRAGGGDARAPTWNHEADLVDYSVRDVLEFALWNGPREFLGRATLSSAAFQPAGFDGELELSAGGAEAAASLSVRIATAAWPERTVPLFSAWWTTGGRGVGAMRDDFTGDVGFRFVPRTALVVTSLGRQAPKGLQEVVDVTLWSAETRSALAGAGVGPNSAVQGGYAFAPLKAEVVLEQGKEYRLSQRCTRGMPDRWFDGAVPPPELFSWSASGLVEFGGGVYSDSHGYPSMADDDARIPTQYRRAGMLNFTMQGRGLQAEAARREPPADEPEACEARELTQIRLVCMSPGPRPPRRQRAAC